MTPVLTCSARPAPGWPRCGSHPEARARPCGPAVSSTEPAKTSGSPGCGRWCATSCWIGSSQIRNCEQVAPQLESEVRQGRLTAVLAADRLVEMFLRR